MILFFNRRDILFFILDNLGWLVTLRFKWFFWVIGVFNFIVLDFWFIWILFFFIWVLFLVVGECFLLLQIPFLIGKIIFISIKIFFIFLIALVFVSKLVKFIIFYNLFILIFFAFIFIFTFLFFFIFIFWSGFFFIGPKFKLFGNFFFWRRRVQIFIYLLL